MRILAHPLLDHRAVDAAEVDRVLEVLAVQPVAGRDRRVLGVEPALDVLADDEGAAARTVVGTRAVVLHPPPELGEDEDRDLIGGVVLAQVGHKVGQRAGHVAQQRGVLLRLVRVRVPADVVGVEDARAHAGGVNARHIAQRLGDRVRAVLNRGLVHPRHGGQDVRAGQRIGAGLAQIVHHQPRAHGGGVHPLENVEVAVALLFFLDVGHQAVGVEIADRGGGHAGRDHRARQTAADVHRRQRLLAVGIEPLGQLGHPTLGRDAIRLAGVQDVHAAEVRARGVGVADALDHGHIAVVVELLEPAAVGVEAERVGDRQHLILRDVHQRARVVVVPLGIRDEGVHEVVAARKLHHDQDRVLTVVAVAAHCRCPSAVPSLLCSARSARVRRTDTPVRRSPAAGFERRAARSRRAPPRCRRPGRRRPARRQAARPWWPR